ncbi:hypothetical protein O181_058411 [Austropuccinia psidii MF-1]|uniref:Uncharacterized protein n=1 Tax=Austropuccinia psidii MF-1 TaxID=1389203 RepID=A0A9Q3HUU1_9BASI|nr:hypothetical protein [Austropuccinia psidii MF-1]
MTQSSKGKLTVQEVALDAESHRTQAPKMNPLIKWENDALQLQTSIRGTLPSSGHKSELLTEPLNLKKGFSLQLWTSSRGLYCSSGLQAGVLTENPDLKGAYFLHFQNSIKVSTPALYLN